MAYPPNQAVYPPVAGIHTPVLYNPAPGFESLFPAGAGGFLPPPPVQPFPTPLPQPTTDWSIPALTEEAAKEAFRQYVQVQCCWSEDPAKDAVITNMQPFNTYRYRLETYTESRNTDWATKPYDGQPLNTNFHPSTDPWQIPVNFPEMFRDSVQEVEIPGTSSVKLCDKCSATGKLDCTTCAGSGKAACTECNGTGKISAEERCNKCSGTGKKNCYTCGGQGKKDCETCKGKRQLLSYVKLTVQWKNNVQDFIAEQASGLKAGKLGNATGKQLFKDAKPMVYPLNGFPDQSVTQASQRMIQEHLEKYQKSARVLQQQHSVDLIPITKVNYQWQGKPYFYFVFGSESKVQVEDYPETCSCCTLL